jgi:epoxyqueuosine reductase
MEPTSSEKHTMILRKEATSLGATLFGVAEIDSVRSEFDLEIREVASELKYAVSMAAALSAPVLETIVDRPTHIYKTHYRHTNMFLDHLATKMASRISGLGFDALPIAASYVIDWRKQSSHLSHKRIARLAGLGWLGRNNLLVTPEFGAAVRLVTVLTNAPLIASKPAEGSCGDCKACLEVCPVGAIRERQEEFDHMACFEQLRKFSKEANFGQHICGLCVKVCRGNSGRDSEAREGQASLRSDSL